MVSSKQNPINGFFRKTLYSDSSLVLFFLFFTVNTLLAYGRLSLGIKLWSGLIGLGVPMIYSMAATSRKQAKPMKPGKREKLFFSFPPWIWALGILAAVLVRFGGLESLAAWPMWDDAYNSFYSIHQARHWEWKLAYAVENVPPLFYWLQGLYFKITGPSLSSLWSFSALVSVLTCGVGCWAARFYLKGPSLGVYAFLVAFSFWPLYLGRSDTPAILLPLWEGALLGCAGWSLDSLHRKNRKIPFLTMGICAAVGLYIHLLAVPVILGISGAVLAFGLLRKPGDGMALLFYFIPFLLLSAPMIPSSLDYILKGHAHDYLVGGRGGGSLASQLKISLSYLTAPLWGTLDKSYFNFGPLWGGYFNPVLSSFFFLGLLEVWRAKGRLFFFGMVGLFLWLMVPGLTSTTVEVMRITSILPFCLGLITVGWEELVSRRSLPKRASFLFFCAALSCGFDLYHLIGPYHQWAVPGPQSADSKSPERYRAFQVLDQVQAKEGPGILLTEFVPNIFDQSLLVAAYPFNAARNPALDPAKAHWVALLAEDSFEGYFAARYPSSRYYRLYEGLPALEGNLDLFLFPLGSSDPPPLQQWLEAHRQVQDLFGLMPYHVARPDYGPALKKLADCRDFFQGDPFLECCYWEKLADVESQDPAQGREFRQSLEMEIHACGRDKALRPRQGLFLERLGDAYAALPQADRLAADAYGRALQAGYESPHLYKQLIQCEMNLRDYRKALWAVRQVWRLEPQVPPPPGMVRWLEDHLRVPPQKAAAP